jgi:hypothetical protein
VDNFGPVDGDHGIFSGKTENSSAPVEVAELDFSENCRTIRQNHGTARVYRGAAVAWCDGIRTRGQADD